MDDFRLGSLYPYDPHGEHEPFGSKRRGARHAKTQPDPAGEPQDEAVISAETQTTEPVEDYYTPSGPIHDSADTDDK